MKKQKKLAKKEIESIWNNTTVGDKVESWNWNANVFEIYDEIRDWSRHDQVNVLTYAYQYFNKDKMINELHSFLIGDSIK